MPNVFFEEGHGKHVLNSSLVQHMFESLNGMELKDESHWTEGQFNHCEPWHGS